MSELYEDLLKIVEKHQVSILIPPRAIPVVDSLDSLSDFGPSERQFISDRVISVTRKLMDKSTESYKVNVLKNKKFDFHYLSVGDKLKLGDLKKKKSDFWANPTRPWIEDRGPYCTDYITESMLDGWIYIRPSSGWLEIIKDHIVDIYGNKLY